MRSVIVHLLCVTSLLAPLSWANSTKNRKFRQCCIAHGVSNTCANYMCNYSDKPFLKENSCKYNSQCRKYTSEYLYCGRDKRDVTQCMTRHTKGQFSPICQSRFSRGTTTPSLDEIFKNGLSNMKCLAHTRQLIKCYGYGLPSSGHQNVCLQKGWSCPKFSHTLSKQAEWFHDAYSLRVLKYCGPPDQAKIFGVGVFDDK